MAQSGDLRICGKVYDSNDLTFREEAEVRKIVRRELVSDGVKEEDLTLGEILPVVALVLRRRDDPDFTLDDAMELKPRDVLLDEEDAKKPAPPTRRGSGGQKKTSAVSGPQKSA